MAKVQKVAVVALSASSPNRALIMEALYDNGLGACPVIDCGSLIDNGQQPDCRPAGSIAAQRRVIRHDDFCPTVVECLKQSTLNDGDVPMNFRLSSGTTLAAVVSECETACLNLVCGRPFRARHWNLTDIDTEDIQSTIAAIIDWCQQLKTPWQACTARSCRRTV